MRGALTKTGVETSQTACTDCKLAVGCGAGGGGAVIQENPPPQQRFITLAPRRPTLNPLLAPPPCSSPPYPPPRYLGLPSIPVDPRTKLQRDCGVGEGWPCSSQVQACLIPPPPAPPQLGNSSFLLRRPHKPFWGGDPELGLGFECSRG